MVRMSQLEEWVSLRYSWLFSAKCFMEVPTCFDCTPAMSLAASSPARYGSSLRYSKLRPQSGERFMFTAGPSSTETPWAWHSSPSASPSNLSTERSKEQELAHAAGKHTALMLSLIDAAGMVSS